MQHDAYGFHRLLHAASLVEETLRRRLATFGVLPRQARILDALDRMGSASQSDLAREFDVTPASMSTMTVRLISAGLISREVDPREIRSNVLRLSEAGRGLLDKIRAVWREIDQVIEAAIGRENAGHLAALTRELRDELGGHVPGASDPVRGRSAKA